MPTTKLTLSADRDLVQQAKKMARRRGTTLSAMFNRYIRLVVHREEKKDQEPLGVLTRHALGMVRLPPDRDDRKLLVEALARTKGK